MPVMVTHFIYPCVLLCTVTAVLSHSLWYCWIGVACMGEDNDFEESWWTEPYCVHLRYSVALTGFLLYIVISHDVNIWRSTAHSTACYVIQWHSFTFHYYSNLQSRHCNYCTIRWGEYQFHRSRGNPGHTYYGGRSGSDSLPWWEMGWSPDGICDVTTWCDCSSDWWVRTSSVHDIISRHIHML